jgi:hypothetical protein
MDKSIVPREKESNEHDAPDTMLLGSLGELFTTAPDGLSASLDHDDVPLVQLASPARTATLGLADSNIAFQYCIGSDNKQQQQLSGARLSSKRHYC